VLRVREGCGRGRSFLIPSHPRPLPAPPLQLRAHLANLRIRLFQHISDAFDERRARLEDDGGAAPGRWAAVRRRFAAVFGGSRDELGSALVELHDEVTAQVGGGWAWTGWQRLLIGCGQREAVRQPQSSATNRPAQFPLVLTPAPLLPQPRQIEAEVAEAWHVMEAATNARARHLAAALNAALDRLSLRVEGAVEDRVRRARRRRRRHGTWGPVASSNA
jgi:hypothetical protein